MAQLKNSLVSGSLRVTDTIYSNNGNFNNLTLNNNIGSNGQAIMSNGTNTYWGSPVEIITSTNTTDSNTLLGNTVDTIVCNGKVIIYKTTNIITAGAQTVTLTTSNNSQVSGALYLADGIAATEEIAAGIFISLIFFNNAFYILNPFAMTT